MNDIIFFFPIESDSYYEEKTGDLSLKSWKKWVKNQKNTEIFVHKDPLNHFIHLPKRWHQWFFLDVLDTHGVDYKQVAVVTSQTMIQPHAPNFFLLNSEFFASAYHVLPFDVLIHKIEQVKSYFPQIELDWRRYFSTDFFLVNERHTSSMKRFTEFLEEKKDELSTDAVHPLFNYWIKQEKIRLRFLNEKYHLNMLKERNLLRDEHWMKMAHLWNFSSLKPNIAAQLMTHLHESWGTSS